MKRRTTYYRAAPGVSFLVFSTAQLAALVVAGMVSALAPGNVPYTISAAFTVVTLAIAVDWMLPRGLLPRRQEVVVGADGMRVEGTFTPWRDVLWFEREQGTSGGEQHYDHVRVAFRGGRERKLHARRPGRLMKDLIRRSGEAERREQQARQPTRAQPAADYRTAERRAPAVPVRVALDGGDPDERREALAQLDEVERSQLTPALADKRVVDAG